MANTKKDESRQTKNFLCREEKTAVRRKISLYERKIVNTKKDKSRQIQKFLCMKQKEKIKRKMNKNKEQEQWKKDYLLRSR